MKVERDRLLSLIEFSQQSARLRGKPAATVTGHRLFALYKHEIQETSRQNLGTCVDNFGKGVPGLP
jgi:hypothetical protein